MGTAAKPEINDATAVVVFGLDEKGKPHASAFDVSEAKLARKAAGLMGMQVLRPNRRPAGACGQATSGPHFRERQGVCTVRQGGAVRGPGSGLAGRPCALVDERASHPRSRYLHRHIGRAS